MFSKCCEIKTVSGQVMGKNSKTKKNKNGCSQNGGSVTGLITCRFFFGLLSKLWSRVWR